MFDLISIGDSVIDTYISLTDAELVTSPKTHNSLLGLRFGDKIPVGNAVSMVAGNAANNAVGAARLGLKTAIYTNVGNFGDDEADNRIKDRLQKEKVDLRYVIETSEFPSNHNIILTFKDDRTILTNHQPWKFSLPSLDQARWIYLTSMSASFVNSAVMDQLASYLERSNAKLQFNPGTFQIKHGVKKYPKILMATMVFIVNLEEAKLVLGFDRMAEVSVKKLLKGIADLGPKMVIITDGAKGSYGFDGQAFWKLGIFPAECKERTGAGDAYATGVLAGLFYGQELPEAMRWGTANSASVIEQIGAQPGLLSLERMQESLKQNVKITTKAFS